MEGGDGVRGSALLCCIAMVVMLLCFSKEGQSEAAYLPWPAPPPPAAAANSTSTAANNSSTTTAPPQQTTFPMYGVTPGSLRPQECGGRCAYRCSATAYRKPCMFFCQKCCAACLCVPPGTYGNKQSCPCYNDWKTKRGGPKCP
ncbi:hypothetical protein E2562_002042 [Oryza meyeriana var. granulata]|uniref:Gibberellin regulated protein n=1 Tax=Oryza meyeriana var. granulata TaxID=110450 RepID=A0A6G1EDB8_9ORYZ|nr:hypothetical protein E2562_002042 [Oryza meyeriana var. granulata]